MNSCFPSSFSVPFLYPDEKKTWKTRKEDRALLGSMMKCTYEHLLDTNLNRSIAVELTFHIALMHPMQNFCVADTPLDKKIVSTYVHIKSGFIRIPG